MNDLLKTLKADYDAKSQAVVTAHTVLATSRTNENRQKETMKTSTQFARPPMRPIKQQMMV